DGIKVLDWSRYVLSEPSQKCGTAQKTVACYQVAEDQADRLRGLGLERAEHQCRKPRLRRGH
ncbi:MAG: hypothetical protein KGQ59_11600, partial [Bdellovibrionales bacterium]|nr:hypothetical protein [Bdellovibrionales bacterium]